MHYPFEPGLMRNEPYFSAGLMPAPGLSADDVLWTKHFYPPTGAIETYETLPLFASKLLQLENGQQANLLLRPDASRKYTIRAFGKADTVMVLFEIVNGKPLYRSGSDDSGTEENAKIEFRLETGREYIVRIRSYYSEEPHHIAVMYW